MLRTPICDFFDIEYPIVLAGMGGFISPSGPELTAAVSNAGGLGVLGGAFVSPDELATAINRTRELTDKPFGVDTLLPISVTGGDLKGSALTWDVPETHVRFAEKFRERHGLPDVPMDDMPIFDPVFIHGQVEVILDMRPPVYVSGLGDPGFLVEQAHQLGMKVGLVVGATRHVQKALASKVDFVVAQGHDGGGHNSRVGAMALIPQVVDAAGSLPVLGAGGIMDGRGLVAALALGAQGVWCGSAFLATDEANITPEQKQAIVESDESNTVVSRSVTGKPARMIKNRWVAEFEASGLEALPLPHQMKVSSSVLTAAEQVGRMDINPGSAGQGIGLVKRIRPAAEVLHDMVAEAHEILSGRLMEGVEVD